MNRIVICHGRNVMEHSLSHQEFLNMSGVDRHEYERFINGSLSGMSISAVPHNEPEKRYREPHSHGFRGYASCHETRKIFGEYEVIVEFHPEGEQGWIKTDQFVVRYYRHKPDGSFDVLGFQIYVRNGIPSLEDGSDEKA